MALSRHVTLLVRIVRYHTRVAGRRLAGATFRSRWSFERTAPEVTIFITSLNTKDALELTIRSLVRHTRYPKYRILVADNDSQDGTPAMLQRLAQHFPIDIWPFDEVSPHREWLDKAARTIKSPYLVGLDSDVLFTGSDWLGDLIGHLESNDELQLVAAEEKRARNCVHDSYSGVIVDYGTAFSSWLFAMRTSLWRRLEKPSFGYVQRDRSASGQPPLVLDTGGALLESMDARNLRYTIMPGRFRYKYLHFGNLSWFKQSDDPVHLKYKEYQLKDIRRRIANWRSHNNSRGSWS